MVLQDEGPLIPKTEADSDFEEFADDVQKEREKKLDALAEFGEDGITPRQIFSLLIGLILVLINILSKSMITSINLSESVII